MTPLLATLLLSPAAPVPKSPMPSQNGYGYLGVRMSRGDNTLTIEPPDPDTPAFRAGLKGGDAIVQLGRIRPISFEELSEYIIDLRPGTEIYVEVKRDGEIVKTRLVLGTRPDTPDYDPTPIFRRRAGLPPPPDDDDK